MKIRIQAEPGELEERAEDVVRVVERLAGRSLHKAGCQCDDYSLHKSLERDKRAEKWHPEAKVIDQTIARSRTRHVERLQKLMDRKIADILKG